MKNLNKKIGAMAIAGMLVLGGVAVSGVSVHANPLGMQIYASYNSNEDEARALKDRELMIKEFGSVFDVEVKDLSKVKVFDNMADLKNYLKEACSSGVYFAVIKADPNREKQDYNIVFSYNYDLFGDL